MPRLPPGTLSVTATPCQLSQRESQGAGVARPAHRNHRIVKSAAQRVSQCEPGGAAALGSPYGGAGKRSETERAFAVANLRKMRRLPPGTLSVTATPCQLSQRESQGAGVARPAQRNDNVHQSAQRLSRRKSGGAAALGSPYGRAVERSETERAYAVANMEICAEIAAGYPLSHGYAVPALPKGEPRGGRCPPSPAKYLP